MVIYTKSNITCDNCHNVNQSGVHIWIGIVKTVLCWDCMGEIINKIRGIKR
jgi:hypothetical protein